MCKQRGGVSIISTGIAIYILKYHVPVCSNARHSLHNAPSSTWTFPSLQSNSPKRLDTCLLHTFLCPIYANTALPRTKWDERTVVSWWKEWAISLQYNISPNREWNGAIHSALMLVAGEQRWLHKMDQSRTDAAVRARHVFRWMCSEWRSGGQAGMIWKRATADRERLSAAAPREQPSTHSIEEWPWLAERAFTAKPSQWSLSAHVETNPLWTASGSCILTKCQEEIRHSESN